MMIGEQGAFGKDLLNAEPGGASGSQPMDLSLEPIFSR